MKDQPLIDLLIRESKHHFSGWDFSHIRDRMVTAPLPWGYQSKILIKIPNIHSLLDMGTGGGEILSSLQPLPIDTHATETYEPNIPIARKKLEPMGVKVHELKDPSSLPFENEYFDLIINRHEFYDPSEVHRILKPNHQFITQQVGQSNYLELNRVFDVEIQSNENYWDLKQAVQQLETCGFSIVEQNEAFPISRIFDVGALVYYLKAIPWQIPDFSIDKYKDKLLEIHSSIQSQGYIEISCHRFFIIAEKNSTSMIDEKIQQSRFISIENTM